MEYDDEPAPTEAPEALTISETTLKWSAREMSSAIVHQAASQIVESTQRELVSEVSRSVKEQIAAQVGERVAQVLDASIQPTNEWGEPKGAASSLREIVAKHAMNYLGAKVNKEGVESAYNADTTRLDYLVKKAVAQEFDYRMQSEVKKAVEMARAQAVAKVGEVVGDLILKLK